MSVTAFAWAALLAGTARASVVSIYKVGYPEAGLCGQEDDVQKSELNPHYFFPIHFGGFHEGPCSDAGYSIFERTEVVSMHPVPGVHHNLTFKLYAKPSVVGAAAPAAPATQLLQLADPARPGHTVEARWCMPAAEEGARTQWPLYIFGHGFDCKPEDYAYFCSTAVTVLVYSTNWTFVDFNTASLAKDAAFLSKELPRLAASEPASPFFGRLGPLAVLGGHSMGGGTSVLAAADAPSAAGMALFAPGLYTLPNAKPYLPKVTMPLLVVSGSDDCGPNTLPKEAQPTYDGASARTKVLVVLKGANHCQWAEPSAGEVGVCSVPFFHECSKLAPEEQHRAGAELLASFLDGLSSEAGWARFEAALAAGEAGGRWTYVSSVTSPAGKALQNDCPCKSEALFA